jgi:hypothetical protein
VFESFIDTSSSSSSYQSEIPSPKRLKIKGAVKMKPTLLLASFLLTFTPTQAIHCYNTGLKDTKTNLRLTAERSCADEFSGSFGPKEWRKICRNNVATKTILEIRNDHPTKSFNLKDSDCVKEFKRIWDHCSTGSQSQGSFAISGGGRNDNAGWYFR